MDYYFDFVDPAYKIPDDVKEKYCFIEMEAEDNNFHSFERRKYNENSGKYYAHSTLRDVNKLKYLSCHEINRLYFF